MKYRYSIKQGDNGYKKIKLPKEISLVEQIFDDMESFGEPIFLDFIKNVMYGKCDFEEISGNICCLDIKKDLTKIFVEFVPDEIQNECYIETNELLKFIELWIEINN